MNPNEKNAKIFACNLCNVICSKNSDWQRHISTNKHKILTNPNAKTPEKIYMCNCGKKYKHMSSLCHHKKKCSESTNKNSDNSNLMFEIVKQNKEFQQLVIDQNKIIMKQNQKIIELSSKPSIINTNSNNTKFNLNFFLNEQCKDALNISDFVNSLKLQLSDLENTGKFGFAEGISKIFIKGLKELDIYKRPIHCSDLKRETMYVKDDNIWEKENYENKKIKKTIDKIAYKNITQIPSWVELHPKCTESTSKDNDLYLNIVNESMGGIDTEETTKYYEKIVKNVSKEVFI